MSPPNSSALLFGFVVSRYGSAALLKHCAATVVAKLYRSFFSLSRVVSTSMKCSVRDEESAHSNPHQNQKFKEPEPAETNINKHTIRSDNRSRVSNPASSSEPLCTITA